MLSMFDRNAYIDEGIAIGEERGKERGMRTANIETARRMRQAGMSDTDIHAFTQLPFEDIRNLL